MEAEERNLAKEQQEPADGNSVFVPGRINICLPGVANQLIPIPLDRVYNVEDRRLLVDCFDILNYTVQMLLDTASHLSPTERERLSNAPCVFVHPMSGLMLHTERSFANFAMECILTEHNSKEALVLSPSWPSVYFDENGYPAFCNEEETKSQTPAETRPQLPSNKPTPASLEPPPGTSAPHITEQGDSNDNYTKGYVKAPPEWKPAKYVPPKRP
ncbi:expressed unknown protein [Seminavis robusta]|uniref:Uncharacterized protein n=1 Tax=Seminavis robusta TaxID=568900 RepID=A0A9N8EV68_9STRA|nr:expressed unknown protein [Seminavis robusta]|eukprot:Sro2089_g313950.1 n/a (215) ;mRNA; f:5370-6185